jgi:hypothetical protein
VLWEDVADAYCLVGPRHWSALLDVALASELYGAEEYGFGANKDASLTGAQIVTMAREGVEGELTYTAMGRAGGLHGAALAADIASGAWRRHEYEVRASGIPNRNWFAVTEFLALLVDETDEPSTP